MPVIRPLFLNALLAAFLLAPCSIQAVDPPPAAPSNLPSPSPLPSPTLRAAAQGRFLIGAAVSSRQLDQPPQALLIASQFDTLTAENEFKPAALQPAPSKFHFASADKLIAFAAEHRMKVIGHTLCWHHQMPSWMFADAAGRPLPREQALANLKRHIETVVGHFKGKVAGWDVVNEAIADERSGYLRDTPALRAIGEDYIARAFEFARAADPAAELYYNDYGIEDPGKRDRVLRLLRALKDQKVPIDAVGIQGHFLLGDPGALDRLDTAIKAYRAAGVKVMITELDVDVLPRTAPGADLAATQAGGGNPYVQGLSAAAARSQADFYARLFNVLLKHPGSVSRVTFWGLHDGACWLNHWPVPGRTNHPLLFDRALQPKPAFDAVVRTLNEPSRLAPPP